MSPENIIKPKKTSELRGDATLLLAAMIWGAAFVAQRVGMDHIGPTLFNGIRFALGAAALSVAIALFRVPDRPSADRRHWLFAAGGAGIILFLAATLQQAGMIYTTAGKAGFITGLYVILTPAIETAFGRSCGRGVWIGAGLAVAGLWALTGEGILSFDKGLIGDGLVLLSAFLWAGHVVWIGRVAPRVEPLRFARAQFTVCALFSLTTGALFEEISYEGLIGAAPAIAYAGLLSVGVGYTLQVVAQGKTPPGRAAVILSLESVFAVLAGALLLSEGLTARMALGCALMFAGMVSARMSPSQTGEVDRELAVTASVKKSAPDDSALLRDTASQ